MAIKCRRCAQRFPSEAISYAHNLPNDQIRKQEQRKTTTVAVGCSNCNFDTWLVQFGVKDPDRRVVITEASREDGDIAKADVEEKTDWLAYKDAQKRAAETRAWKSNCNLPMDVHARSARIKIDNPKYQLKTATRKVEETQSECDDAMALLQATKEGRKTIESRLAKAEQEKKALTTGGGNRIYELEEQLRKTERELATIKTGIEAQQIEPDQTQYSSIPLHRLPSPLLLPRFLKRPSLLRPPLLLAAPMSIG